MGIFYIIGHVQVFCLTSAKSIRVLRPFWEKTAILFYLLFFSASLLDHDQRDKAYVPMLWQKSRHFVFIFLTIDCLLIIFFSKFPAGSQQLCCLNQSVLWKGLTPSDLLVCDQDQEWWMSYSTVPSIHHKPLPNISSVSDHGSWNSEISKISMIIVKLKSHENASWSCTQKIK